MKNKTTMKMFSCEFAKISKSTFFTEHLRMTASVQVFTINSTENRFLRVYSFMAQNTFFYKNMFHL